MTAFDISIWVDARNRHGGQKLDPETASARRITRFLFACCWARCIGITQSAYFHYRKN